MKKSSVIATCLVNSGVQRTLDDGDFVVRRVFEDELPSAHFDRGNTEINDGIADNIIKGVGRASMINIKKFIEDLWK